MEVDVNTLVAVIVVFIGAVIAAFSWLFKQTIDSKVKLTKIETHLEHLQKSVDGWQIETRHLWVDMYKIAVTKTGFSNPITPEEKMKLLEKFKAGTIKRAEIEELKAALEKDKKDAEEKKDIVATIIIGMILGGLAYLLYQMLQEK
jgi:S-adenosylhomocysteine hydrolase